MQAYCKHATHISSLYKTKNQKDREKEIKKRKYRKASSWCLGLSISMSESGSHLSSPSSWSSSAWIFEQKTVEIYKLATAVTNTSLTFLFKNWQRKNSNGYFLVHYMTKDRRFVKSQNQLLLEKSQVTKFSLNLRKRALWIVNIWEVVVI